MENGKGSGCKRYTSQLGPLNTIFNSNSCFVISALSPKASGIALQTSQNLYQYYGADSEVLASEGTSADKRGNVITIGLGRPFPVHRNAKSPVRITDHGVRVNLYSGSTRLFELVEGIGAIYLSPLSESRPELVIWGIDEAGLRQAARLLPLLTGVGQPEFIILSQRCGWQGAAGVLAMGSYTNDWKASKGAYIL